MVTWEVPELTSSHGHAKTPIPCLSLKETYFHILEDIIWRSSFYFNTYLEVDCNPLQRPGTLAGTIFMFSPWPAPGCWCHPGKSLCTHLASWLLWLPSRGCTPWIAWFWWPALLEVQFHRTVMNKEALLNQLSLPQPSRLSPQGADRNGHLLVFP